MFSGIVKELGTVMEIINNTGKTVLFVQGNVNLSYSKVKVNDSIAVNGVCLTVVEVLKDVAVFEVLPETLRKTNLCMLSKNMHVNLEDAITIADKIGGHNVQGHIDCTATIVETYKDGDAIVTVFSLPKEYADMLVPKAYIAIDGMSLTIVSVNKDTFSVMLIPHTVNVTVASLWRVGSIVNIEVDILNKSIWHYLKNLEILKGE
jgi:riboflavin synthase